MPTLTHKRGDTFSMACTVAEADGTPVNTTGWTIASQVRDARDKVVCALTVADRNDSVGTFRVHAGGTEATWPVGGLLWDIQYTDSAGTIRSTETIAVNVLQDVTHA